MPKYALLIALTLIVSASPAIAAEPADGWVSVGAAKVDVTPTHPVVLAGYGSRTTEFEGVDEPIWARALAMGDDSPLLVVAVDNCGVTADITNEASRRLQDNFHIPRRNVVICSTHTHSAPSLTGYVPILWKGRLTPEQEERSNRYTKWLTGKIVEAAVAALDARQPAQLAWNQGVVTFGGNRRVLRGANWAGFGLQPDGPVDHSLPMLVARSKEGQPFAIWVNYACHCTTLGSRNTVSGDWAGYTNQAIEKDHAGAIAITTIGCGADVGPQPTGSVDNAKQHGRAIADEINRLLPDAKPLRTISQSAMRTIQLPLAAFPDQDEWKERAKRGNFDGQHARLMLERIERDGKLSPHVEYPITVWRFGDDLAMVFLAGEVCVDYAVRLKTELDWRRLWINGWSNDVPCYIPSRRILQEGGYEADFSMIYYGHPSRFAPEVEDAIVSTVKEMVPQQFASGDSPQRPSFLHRPTSRDIFARRATELAASATPDELVQMRERLQLAAQSQKGFAKLVATDGGEDSWFDFSGAQSRRPFVRQLKPGDSLSWTTPPVRVKEDSEKVVLLFLGGIGWESSPQTAGFALLLNGRELLDFDVSRVAKSWTNEDGSAALHYLPTWASDEDSAGLFYLVADRRLFKPDEPCTLAVTSKGSQSQRWFALDKIEDVKSIERQLTAAVQTKAEAQ